MGSRNNALANDPDVVFLPIRLIRSHDRKPYRPKKHETVTTPTMKEAAAMQQWQKGFEHEG